MKRAAVAALVLLAACGGGGGGEHVKFDPPLSYHITYDVTSGKQGWTEDLWVKRPFVSDDWSRRGDEELSRVVADLGRQVLNAASPTRGLLHVPPNPAPGDVRLDAVVDYARDHGLIQVRGRKKVAARTCTVYRSAKPLVTRTMAAKPTASKYVDTCVDGHGLVLEERNGAMHKRALRVELGGTHEFDTNGDEVPVQQGGGQVTGVTAESRPPGEDFWSLDTPPTGFTRFGRYAVVPPQPPVAFISQGPNSVASSVDDVFTDGRDVIVVSQGRRASALEAGGTSVGVGALGKGRLYVSAVGSRVVVPLQAKGAYVEVRGTVTPERLLAVAKAMTRHPPGTLVTR
jgi:hypothetical protein